MEGTRSERETTKGRKERSIEMHHTCIRLMKTNLINKMTRKFLEKSSVYSWGSNNRDVSSHNDISSHSDFCNQRPVRKADFY